MPRDMLDVAVTIIRFPVALICAGILIVVVLPLETAFLVVWLPVVVIVMNRQDVRASWVAQYPNTIRKIKELFRWVDGG